MHLAPLASASVARPLCVGERMALVAVPPPGDEAAPGPEAPHPPALEQLQIKWQDRLGNAHFVPLDLERNEDGVTFLRLDAWKKMRVTPQSWDKVVRSEPQWKAYYESIFAEAAPDDMLQKATGRRVGILKTCVACLRVR